MGSSPEVEKFEITEDDLENEFNPNRPTFRMTKHQATYGVWADNDSDDERPTFSKGKQSRNYTAPVNFVSGGVKVGDKVTKDDDEDEEGEGPPTDSDEEYDRMPAPQLFAGRKNRRKGYIPTGGRNDSDGLGEWEKHTRGIGQKLLRQMGHVKGKGLGKNLQGISTPVEAMKRKGKGAVGYHGTERTERSLQDFPVKKGSDEEAEEKFQAEVAQWKKGQGEKKKVKYKYRTADELISTGGKKLTRKEKQSELAKVKVIDMTGKEQRVLSGYHALAHKHDRPDEDDEPPPKTAEKKVFELPELMHNLDLLVDMSEEAIINNNRKLHYEEDMVVNLKHEKEKLDKVCEQEEKQITTLKDVLHLIEECENRTASDSKNPMTLEECAKFFKKLQDDYYEEYKMYELSSLAVPIVFPLMRKVFENWEPLKNPRHGTSIMKDWKAILEGMGQPLLYNQDYIDPYDRLVWEVWMPEIRKAISNKWSVRECDAVLELLEVWMPVLPSWILSNILEQLIFPKLQQEVESWNPLTDTIPIHAWLHPWLPLMGDRLEPLYGPIRHKLANALTNWHPSDTSAKLILEPWHKVFSPGHMQAFLLKNIVPKLSLCMQEFLINPHEQHLDGWRWLMAWIDLVPKQYIVTILEKHFFPKWLKVLSAWLTSSPNYDEVTHWYSGWKAMFPDVLLADPLIKEQFNKALSIMNRAVTGKTQPPGARENVAYLASTERRRDYESQAAYERREYDSVRGITASGSVPTSFKDLVERRAEEYGILFMPLVGKYREAKQIYCFGEMQIYFDRNVVFLLEPQNQKWVPVSLNTLIDRAK